MGSCLFKGGVTFIDIGKYAITMAYHTTAEAQHTSADLRPRTNIEMIEKGVNATTGFATFNLNDIAPTGAGLRPAYAKQQLVQIQLCTRDATIKVPPGSSIIKLIDIESGELNALRGGHKLIDREKSLINFEYNATTHRFFQLFKAEDLLDDSFDIYRARSENGRLDNKLTSTWNVVSLPQQGPWQHLNQQQELFPG